MVLKHNAVGCPDLDKGISKFEGRMPAMMMATASLALLLSLVLEAIVYMILGGTAAVIAATMVLKHRAQRWELKISRMKTTTTSTRTLALAVVATVPTAITLAMTRQQYRNSKLYDVSFIHKIPRRLYLQLVCSLAN